MSFLTDKSNVNKWMSYIEDVYSSPQAKEKMTPITQTKLRKGIKVKTPKGNGKVWCVDRDGLICVALDGEDDVLHEFESNEVERVNSKKTSGKVKTDKPKAECIGGACEITKKKPYVSNTITPLHMVLDIMSKYTSY
jgi:hypothetical protein